jgi:hypothetical protein
MKTIYCTLFIFLTSLIIDVPLKAESDISNGNSIALDGGWKGVNKKSAKRFKTHRGQKRRKHTCMNKNGCKKHKVIKGKKSKCPVN